MSKIKHVLVGRKDEKGVNVEFRYRRIVDGTITDGIIRATVKTIISMIEDKKWEFFTKDKDNNLVLVKVKNGYLTSTSNDGKEDNVDSLKTY